MTIWKSGLPQAPVITVPTITLEGDANGAPHPDRSVLCQEILRQVCAPASSTGGIGHNLPQEAPQAFAEAIVDVDRY